MARSNSYWTMNKDHFIDWCRHYLDEEEYDEDYDDEWYVTEGIFDSWYDDFKDMKFKTQDDLFSYIEDLCYNACG